MASGKQETISKPNVPEMGQQEKDMLGMITNTLMPMYMEETGYEVTTTPVDHTQDPKWANAQNSRARASEIDPILHAMNTVKVPSGDPKRQVLERSKQELLTNAEKVEAEVRGEYAGRVTTSYRKKASPKVEQIRARFGADSQEYKTAFAAYEKDAVEIDEAKRKLNRSVLDKTQKFLNGDFSINQAQRDLIQENMAPQRAAIEKMYSEMEARSGEGFQAEQKLLDHFFGKIQESGLPPDAAIGAIGNQFLNGGEFGKSLLSMDQALTNVVESNKALMKMGIEDATGEITKNISAQAAALGRDPSDPAYAMEMQKMVLREVQRGQLGITEMESRGRMSIQEQALMLRGQELGARQELTGRKSATGTEMVRGRGLGNLAMEEQASNLRYQMGGFMTPQQTGTALNVSQFQEALKQQQIQNLGNSMAYPMGMAEQLRASRMAKTSTTQNVTTTPSPLEIGLGVATAGAFAFGG